MKTEEINVSDLRLGMIDAITDVIFKRKEIVIMYHGKPYAAILAIDKLENGEKYAKGK